MVSFVFQEFLLSPNQVSKFPTVIRSSLFTIFTLSLYSKDSCHEYVGNHWEISLTNRFDDLLKHCMRI